MSAQRAALTVVANCCHDVVSGDDFRCVRDSLSMLVARLTQQVSQIFLILVAAAHKKFIKVNFSHLGVIFSSQQKLFINQILF